MIYILNEDFSVNCVTWKCVNCRFWVCVSWRFELKSFPVDSNALICVHFYVCRGLGDVVISSRLLYYGTRNRRSNQFSGLFGSMLLVMDV